MDDGDQPRRDAILFLGREPSLAGALHTALSTRGLTLSVKRDAGEIRRTVWTEPVPLVIVDLTLPGIDGVALARALKSEPAAPRILAIGSDAVLVDLRRALRKEHRFDRTILSSAPINVLLEEILALLPPARPRGTSVPTSSIDRGFGGTLIELWRRSSTGILHVDAETVKTTIYFLNGEPVFAEHGSLADSLGRTLVRTGVLTENQLARAISRMTEGLVASEQMRLGEVLIELGMLSPEHVQRALEQQVRAKVVSCFQYRAPNYEFDERSDFLHEIGIFKCTVPPLLLEGIRKYYDSPRIAAILGPRLEKFPRLRGDLGTVMNRYRLGSTEQKFLRGVTGNRTVAKLQESSNLDRLTGGQLLAALILTEELELWSEPSTVDIQPMEGSQDLPTRPPSGSQIGEEGGFIVAEYLRMKGKSDAEVLRVRRDAGVEEIERAFDAGEQRFGPEASRDLAPHLARKAGEIHALMKASRDRMLEAARRRRKPSLGDNDGIASPQRSRLLAETAYQRGKQLLAESSLVRALEELTRAADALPSAPEFRLLAEYTRYLLAADDESRRAAKESARELAEKTIALDPNHAKGHAILGRFLRLEGDLEAAERHLRHAIQLDRSDPTPQTELELLAQQQAKK